MITKLAAVKKRLKFDEFLFAVVGELNEFRMNLVK
jgi:hypothetical protein